MSVRYASVCDGIGAAHVAWQPLGWQCSWTSEIEPFPAAVVEHHFGFPNVGDMTKITEEMLDEHGTVDLLVGGTPCQSFSVAGLRGGLADPRGNLALRFVQLAAVMQPKWIVWENVPGVLSSGKGRDFGTFLGALGQLGYGFAYRILDAQWHGVAQRRRRVFVVGHLGDWRRAAAVLFERESVFGNPPTRGATGQGITSSPEGIAGNVSSKWAKGTGGPAGDECYNLVAEPQAFYSNDSYCDNIPPPNVTPPMKVCSVAAVAQGFTYSGYSNQPAWMTGDRTDCLPASGHSDGSHQGVGVAIGFDGFQSGNPKATHQATEEGTGPLIRHRPHCVATPMAVRRLTPRECERLQGFPDDFTAIEYRKKPAADGPRYRALGNSMAVPVMRWIGERIALVDALSSSEERHTA
jgi:DNA (cytosine-5)-methyltransferase 1